MTGHWPSDPGSESLVVVGPVMDLALTPAILNRLGLGDAPQIAVDGGIRFAQRPMLWGGDGDSGKAPKNIPAIIKENQDETDLRFCLNGIRPWRWRKLHLFGFVGARRDHELANFGEIHAEMKQRRHFQRAVFYDPAAHVLAVFHAAGEHVFTHRGLFSVIAFEPASISLSGDCRYPAADLQLDVLSGTGISNEASGAVQLTASGPVAIFFPPHG